MREAVQGRKSWLWGLLLFGVALLVYLPALRGGFLWDDDTSLTANKLIKALEPAR